MYGPPPRRKQKASMTSRELRIRKGLRQQVLQLISPLEKPSTIAGAGPSASISAARPHHASIPHADVDRKQGIDHGLVLEESVGLNTSSRLKSISSHESA
jgi:hypothetical protein